MKMLKEFSVRKLIWHRILWAILICIVVGCLLLRVKQSVSDHVTVLSFQQENKSFSEDDILIAEKEDVNLTYIKRLYPEISNGFRTEKTEVIATNDNYAYFTNLEFIKGTFFNQKQIENGLPVVVLNEAAADLLFGNYDCIGESVYLDQNGFNVVGIVKERRDEKTAKIYVPDKVTVSMDMSCLEVNQLYCQFDNEADAAMLIQEMGYSIEEMEIVQTDGF